MTTAIASQEDCLQKRVERDLMQRVARGEVLALDELYSQYATIVFNSALWLVHDRYAAEDITQEVFISAWRGAWRFRSESSVKTWLLRTTHHRSVDWLRKQRPSVSIDDVPFELPDHHSTDEFESIATIDQIRQALARLSVMQRSVIELTFVHDLTYREIAQVMGCPIGTVKSRMSYALRIMRREINAAQSEASMPGTRLRCAN